VPVIILPEKPADLWDLDDWREKVAKENPGGSGAHSLQNSEEALLITTTSNKVRSCLQQILGWSWADFASPYRLHREAVPVQHPRFPWLWADSVAPLLWNPLAQHQTVGANKAKEDSVGFEGYSPAFTTRYTQVDILVRFKPVWGRQWADTDPTWADNYIGKEWMRNVGTVGKSVQLDLITAEGAGDAASLYWAEGGGDGPTAGSGSASAFNGTQYVRRNVTKFQITWRAVPIEYTCGRMDFDEAHYDSFMMPLPVRLVRQLGTVNDAPFPGTASRYKAGTLLFSALEEHSYQLPVRTDSEFGSWAADYTLSFDYMDPPRDPAAVKRVVSGPTPDPKYGHHLFPWRKTRYWYLATAGDSTTRGSYNGVTALESTNFTHLFRHADDPTYAIP
jgi:hypothetical protein